MRLRTSLILSGILVLLISFGLAFSKAEAAPSLRMDAAAHPSVPGQTVDNSVCLSCHSQAGMSVQLGSGETLPLTIDPALYQESVHGTNEVACTTCHTDITGFPHPERTVETVRDVKLVFSTACQQCHAEQFDLTMDSVHQTALDSGNKDAAVCADCHNPHTQQRLTNKDTGKLLDYARLQVPKTCAQCHSTIFDKYKESVHGKALTQEGNLDVPTCIDCHGVHNIQSPTTATFRNSTPYLCATCHTNNALMHKYGLSTNVLNTYVADFHGTTVVLFDKTYPDQPTNKPVCTDCHGVHDIVKVDDPQKGLEVRQNLLVRCQKCHPGATANFPDAWMSHYIPSPEKYPIVYYVNLFYKFFIPAVLGPMLVLVLMDFGRMAINRFRKKPVMVEEAAEVEPEIKVGESAPVEAEVKEETEPAVIESTLPEQVEEPAQPEQKEADETESAAGEFEPEPPAETKPSDEEEKSND
ncbi:MAG: cytochrome c3 family protein [Anaerolineales bacterium]